MKKKRIVITVIVSCLLATPAMASDIVTIGLGEGYHETGYVVDGYPVVESDSLPVTLQIDGSYLPSDVDPIIKDGRTLVPLRIAGEALGAEVEWSGLSQSITVNRGNDTIIFKIGNNSYSVNGAPMYTDVAPQIVRDRTMLPFRVFAEALNANVDWDQNTYRVIIDTEKPNASAPELPAETPEELQKLATKYYVAPDPSDPRIGSWSLIDADYVESEKDLMFVSKYGDTYQVISVSYSSLGPTCPLMFVYVTKDEGFDGYNNNLIFTVDQWPSYYRGQPLKVASWLDSKEYFYAEGNSMSRMMYCLLDGSNQYFFNKATYNRF